MEERFAVVDLAAGHDPLTAKRFNAASGQQHPILIVDDAADDAGFDLRLFEIHNT
jgi:hypothetical protein